MQIKCKETGHTHDISFKLAKEMMADPKFNIEFEIVSCSKEEEALIVTEQQQPKVVERLLAEEKPKEVSSEDNKKEAKGK